MPAFVGLFKDLFNFLPGKSQDPWETIQSRDRPTVILVSGFAATHRTLSVIRKRLIRDGFNVIVLSMDWQALSDSVRGLYRMSERLSSVVLRLRKEHGMKKAKIFLVAHSAGGLVARYYVQLLGGSHYCDGLVTLATPHSGTWMAIFGFFSHFILKARCLIQMLPISPFIKRLNQASFPSGFKMLSICSSDDYLCPPYSTRLPPALTHHREIECVEVRRVSHTDFLLSKKAYQLLLGYLGKTKPSGHAADVRR